MTTLVTDTNVLKCTPNLCSHNSQRASHELYLSCLSPDELATWGAKYPADLSYRVELARRIAFTFDDADQLIIFDDIAIQMLGSEPSKIAYLRGFDRSFLPALWLSTGFRCGGRILVYAPPNPVELEAYLKLKSLIEQYLQRTVRIEILYEDLIGHVLELIRLFEDNPKQYTTLCEEFAQQSSKEFYPLYHVHMLKRHFEIITKDVRRSFVFPYDMTGLHQRELKMYSDRLSLPDISKNDKARHHFVLKSKGFTALPRMIAAAAEGSLIESYEEYTKILKKLNTTHTKNTRNNIEIFARAIIQAIDQLHNRFDLPAFVKLDSSGAGGWSSMSPNVHPIIYDCKKDQEERVFYLQQHIEKTFDGDLLPEMAVVEELIEPQKRSGDIDADYTVCGFVLNGKFFPTSISLCGTENGAYIEQWTSSSPADLQDSLTIWQMMFDTYSLMIDLEATEFGYMNGLYAGDLFITKDGQLKQRDWNIRRGGRSSPESLIIFGMPNYETKVIFHMADLGLDGKINNVELFRAYTQICQRLSQDYGMYTFSSAFGYVGKNSDEGDALKFNILVHPKILTSINQNGEKQNLSKSGHRKKVTELIKDTVTKILLGEFVEH